MVAPTPLRSRPYSAASTAWAPAWAAAASMIGTPTFCGGRPGSPVTDIRPLSACAAMS